MSGEPVQNEKTPEPSGGAVDATRVGATLFSGYDAATEPVWSSFSLGRLYALFFVPSEFFARDQTLVGPSQLVAVWLVGMASVGDRAATAFVAWPSVWIAMIVGGLVVGSIQYAIGGWFYGVRLRWSGASAAAAADGRSMWTFVNLVFALPVVLMTLLMTVMFEDSQLNTAANTMAAVVAGVFIVWADIVSYLGVLTRYDVQRWKAALWFLILPIVVVVVLFVLTFVLAFMAALAAAGNH